MDPSSFGEPVIPRLRHSFHRRLLGPASVAALLIVAACSSGPAKNDVAASGVMLQNSLPVAAAALAAGQPDVARRLYLSLAERFEDAPEPLLGLAYIAFHSGDLATAEKHFLEAAGRARTAPATQAEALLGAGRAALAQNRLGAARKHFERARKAGPDTPSAPWIANGLAVGAALEADYATAESQYTEALRHSPGDPRVTANLVRMLVEAGRIEDAARAHAGRAPSFWVDDDGRTLPDLIEGARRERRRQTSSGEGEALSGTALDLSCAELGSARADSRGEERALATSGHDFAPDLALRLSAFGPPATSPASNAALSGEDASPHASGLVLRLGDWSGPRTPLQVVSCTKARSESTTTPASSAPSEKEGAQDTPPASPSVAGDTQAPSGIETPAGGTLDHSSPTTLTLTLGQSRRLRLTRRATSVVVAAPEIADVQLSSPNMLHIIGRGVGRTSIAVLNGDWVEEQVVLVVVDLEPLRTMLAGEPGLDAVQARQLARGVALSGEVPSAAAADRALRLAAATLPEGVPIENDLRITTPQQVNLEVQIAEVNRSVTEELGINWESFGIKNAERFGFRIGRVLSPVAGDGFDLGAFPPTVAGGNTAASLFFGSKGPLGQFRAMIDALATAGLANVLARPNVTAVSGEAASFFSGGEYPLPTGFEDGVIVFEYKKYGVLLDFVPTVVDADRIVLKVRPEVSEPSLNESVQIVGVEIPVINVRRAETTVEVGDGESIVIAGLFRNASNTVETGVTGLKDIPLLGALFGKTSIRSNELELIVIVTARLVHARTTPDDASSRPTSASRRAKGYHY